MAHTPLTRRMNETVLFEDDTIIVTRSRYGTVRVSVKSSGAHVSAEACAGNLLLVIGEQRAFAVPTSNGIAYEIEGKK